MDQELKQRLVGAIVITALAAIFVPMLFDDPVDETGKRINELEIPPMPERLADSQSFNMPESREEVINLPVKQQLKVATPESDQVPALTRWYLQVGLFSQEENALALRDKLRRQGFATSINKVNSEKGVLYKVKVGPELNKDRAEMVKVRLEKMADIKGFVTQD